MVELNKTYTVAIGGMTYDGMGIARINGFAVFVRGAIPGEEAVVKVIKVYKGYAIGRLEKFNLIDSESGKRVVVISFHKRNKPIDYLFR
jgi:predicted RNA-binding protein with TRAM domain